MNLSKLINYAMSHGKDNTCEYNMEFEIRFGKYSRVSSNIKQNIFFKVYNRANGKKSYKLTDETFYDNKDKDPIRQRIVFDDVNTYDIRLIQQALTHYDFYIMERGENKMCLERSNGLQKS